MTHKESQLFYQTPLGEITGYLDYSGPLECAAALEVSDPILPEGMRVSACRVFTWTIKAKEDRGGFKAVCKLEPSGKVDGGPESGEHLAAEGWKSESHILSLGTDDGEALNRKAKTGENVVPKRFYTQNFYGLTWVNYVDYGFEINVPDLRKNEQIALRFAVAWKEREEERDSSTWFAVGLALD